MKQLKDLTQYHYKAMESFFKFLKDDDLDELISNLCGIQRHYTSWRSIRTHKRHIWFRFFSGDTMATTINDIIHTFRNDTQQNKDYMRECMQICCDKGEVEVYYS
jgi:hypothetical protein